MLPAGEPVFFRLRVANLKKKKADPAPAKPDSPPATASANKASSPRAAPSKSAKPRKRFAMAITRMDEGFELPEVRQRC